MHCSPLAKQFYAASDRCNGVTADLPTLIPWRWEHSIFADKISHTNGLVPLVAKRLNGARTHVRREYPRYEFRTDFHWQWVSNIFSQRLGFAHQDIELCA